MAAAADMAAVAADMVDLPDTVVEALGLEVLLLRPLALLPARILSEYLLKWWYRSYSTDTDPMHTDCGNGSLQST